MTTPGELASAPHYALAFRTLEPAPESPRRLLVLLHGVGGEETQLAALGAQVDAGTLVVLPRAPRTVGGGSFGWFRVGLSDDGPQIVPEEAEDARQRLVDFVGQLQQHRGIAPSHTVVAGFSQGGVLSASVALTAPERVAGFAVLCGRILPEIEPLLAPRAALAELDALIVHGRTDATLPMAWAERADALLRRLGVPHRLRLHDAGHELVPAMQRDFRDWFGKPGSRWNTPEHPGPRV